MFLYPPSSSSIIQTRLHLYLYILSITHNNPSSISVAPLIIPYTMLYLPRPQLPMHTHHPTTKTTLLRSRSFRSLIHFHHSSHPAAHQPSIKLRSSWDVLGPLNRISTVSPSLKVVNDIGILTRLGFSSGFSSTLSDGSAFSASLTAACQEISTSL